MAKVNYVQRDINLASRKLHLFMKEHLDSMAEEMILSIVKAVKNSTPAQKVNAYKEIKYTGKAEYKAKLFELLSAISEDAFDKLMVKFKKHKAKLADDLKPGVRKRIKNQIALLTETQFSDLEKAVVFQFTSSIDSTDSVNLLAADLAEAAENYIEGPHVAGAASMAASKTIADTRNDIFLDQETADQIEGYYFINDVPVSDICQHMVDNFGKESGNYIDKNDPNLFRYSPPLHWGCDGTLEPILTGELKGDKTIKKFSPSKSIENKIQFFEKPCDH